MSNRLNGGDEESNFVLCVSIDTPRVSRPLASFSFKHSTLCATLPLNRPHRDYSPISNHHTTPHTGGSIVPIPLTISHL